MPENEVFDGTSKKLQIMQRLGLAGMQKELYMDAVFKCCIFFVEAEAELAHGPAGQ